MTENEKELFEERSAIRQYDGLETKEKAEKNAMIELNLYKMRINKNPTELLKSIKRGLTNV